MAASIPLNYLGKTNQRRPLAVLLGVLFICGGMDTIGFDT